MAVVLAALPPAVALLLLLARSGPVWAAVAALSAAAVLAWLGFPTSPAGLRDAALEIAPLCIEVTLILLGGVLLNEILTAAGAQQRLGAWVAGLCREPARAVVTVLFLALGALMAAARMSETLAHASAGLGPAYPALAPWLGALGGFLTGSNTGANAMFAASQAEAARAIGYPVLALVAFQNVAASLATTASVPRVALAVSLARDGSAGVDSGRVLRTVLAVDIVVLVSLSGTAVLLPGTLFA